MVRTHPAQEPAPPPLSALEAPGEKQTGQAEQAEQAAAALPVAPQQAWVEQEWQPGALAPTVTRWRRVMEIDRIERGDAGPHIRGRPVRGQAAVFPGSSASDRFARRRGRIRSVRPARRAASSA